MSDGKYLSRYQAGFVTAVTIQHVDERDLVGHGPEGSERAWLRASYHTVSGYRRLRGQELAIDQLAGVGDIPQ